MEPLEPKLVLSAAWPFETAMPVDEGDIAHDSPVQAAAAIPATDRLDQIEIGDGSMNVDIGPPGSEDDDVFAVTSHCATSSGFTVYFNKLVNPTNLKTVMKTITEIGAFLNAGSNAQSVVQDMKSRIQKVKHKISKANDRPRVFFQIGIAPIVSVGTHTFAHELIELAGGINLSKGPTPYPRFSKEKVLSLRPEVFIITSMSRNAIFEQVKKEWSKWPSLPAVRDQRIHLEDSNLFDRPTPRLVDGLENLARRIHPELFAQEPFGKEN